MSNSKTETGSVELPPGALSGQGVMNLNNGVLTIKNPDLANLIHAKLAAAAQLNQNARATDVDVGVSVKVKG